MNKRVKKWVKGSGIAKHKGALHRALGVAKGKKIPYPLLLWATHQPGHLGHMAREAKTMRGFKHRRKAKHRRSR